MIQYVGLAVCFQFTHFLCDYWENIYTLSYYHHQIGTMNCYPLFRVRSWSNGVHCMSFCILLNLITKNTQCAIFVIVLSSLSSPINIYFCLRFIRGHKSLHYHVSRVFTGLNVSSIWSLLRFKCWHSCRIATLPRCQCNTGIDRLIYQNGPVFNKG